MMHFVNDEQEKATIFIFQDGVRIGGLPGPTHHSPDSGRQSVMIHSSL